MDLFVGRGGDVFDSGKVEDPIEFVPKGFPFATSEASKSILDRDWVLTNFFMWWWWGE